MRAIKAQEQQQMEKPSFGELIGRLATESGQLVRDEISLAKHEISEKVSQSVESGKLFAAGAVLGLGTLFSLCAFLILVLDIWLPAWAAAGLVTMSLGIATYLALQTGLAKWRSLNKNLNQTMETLEEDKRWIKDLDLTK